MDVEEQGGPGFLHATNPSVADLVQSLNKLKTNTRDVISILRAVKAAGALHAELIVQ
jgi:flagellar P-ring protein precursor FlgI